jgi:peptide/nickel transport system permease protein
MNFYTVPHFMFWPGMAIYATVLAFILLRGGLRDAFDPKGR